MNIERKIKIANLSSIFNSKKVKSNESCYNLWEFSASFDYMIVQKHLEDDSNKNLRHSDGEFEKAKTSYEK